MSQIVPRNSQAVIPSEEMVREQVQSVVAKTPDLVSFDATTEQGEYLALRCQTDPGIPAQLRDGWRGTVSSWWVGTYLAPDERSGELVALPSVCLLTEDGELCRLTGWPAINSWCGLLRAAGAERCALGIRVRVARRLSGTAGRSYWTILPDEGGIKSGQ